MAIAIRSERTQAGTATAGGVVAITKPSDVQNDDYVIIIISKADDPAFTGLPSGFTTGDASGTATTNPDLYCGIYYKKITNSGGEPATYDFTTAASLGYGCWIGSLSGIHLTTPQDVSFTGRWQGGSSNKTAPSVTTVTDGAFVFAAWAENPDTTTTNPTSPWEDRINDLIFASSVLCVSSMTKATAGATGDAVLTTTSGTDDSWNGQFAFRPAASNIAPTVVLNTNDTLVTSDTTPTLEFMGTDTESNDIRYNVQIDTVNTFDSASVADSYSETNQSGFNNIGGGGGTTAGQSFTGNGEILGSVQFYMKKTGTPSGSITCYIYAHAGTFGTNGTPTGAILATSAVVNINTLTTSYVLTQFNFSGANRITLTNGTKYFAIAEYSSGTGDLQMGLDDSSPTHGGNYYDDSIQDEATWDLCFYVNTVSPLLDKVSGTDAGFLNTVNGGDTDPFTSGQMVSYTVQSALAAGTYHWRARGLDPSGTNTYGAWATTQTFTIGNIAYTPNFFYFT